VLCNESEGIPATVTELTELRGIIRLFPAGVNSNHAYSKNIV